MPLITNDQMLMGKNEHELANERKRNTRNTLFDVDLSTLDDSQRQAVLSDEPLVLATAPAGSGKTTVIINAIANYRCNYLSDRICAITFTRAARAEMEERLAKMGINDVEVTTIHVWCRNLLEQLGKKYHFQVSILTDSQIKMILSDLAQQYEERKMVYNRSRRSFFRINVDILQSYILGNKNMEISDALRNIFNSIEREYISYKRQNLLYDFSDYPLYLRDILEGYDEYIKNIDALFVDEFQDVDPDQVAVFERVIGARKKFFVGDKWQSIYGFRGSDSEIFDRIPEFTRYQLKSNYRSYQPIIDYATTVYKSLKDSPADSFISEIRELQPSGVQCDRGAGEGECSVLVVDFMGTGTELGVGSKVKLLSQQQVVNEITSRIFNEGAMMLCRTNKQVALVNSLGALNATTIHQAKGLEYDNVVVLDTKISDDEDLNIAYVALTRAKNKVAVVDLTNFEYIMEEYANRSSPILQDDATSIKKDPIVKSIFDLI